MLKFLNKETGALLTQQSDGTFKYRNGASSDLSLGYLRKNSDRWEEINPNITEQIENQQVSKKNDSFKVIERHVNGNIKSVQDLTIKEEAGNRIFTIGDMVQTYSGNYIIDHFEIIGTNCVAKFSNGNSVIIKNIIDIASKSSSVSKPVPVKKAVPIKNEKPAIYKTKDGFEVRIDTIDDLLLYGYHRTKPSCFIVRRVANVKESIKRSSTGFMPNWDFYRSETARNEAAKLHMPMFSVADLERMREEVRIGVPLVNKAKEIARKKQI